STHRGPIGSAKFSRTRIASKIRSSRSPVEPRTTARERLKNPIASAAEITASTSADRVHRRCSASVSLATLCLSLLLAIKFFLTALSLTAKNAKDAKGRPEYGTADKRR